jgi:rubrerythrin
MILMVEMDEAQCDLADLLFCSNILEEKTATLYKIIAEKIQRPLVKSFLLHIAYDSQKHSAIFKGLSESIGKPSIKLKDCAKRLGQIWKMTESFTHELASKQRLSEERLAQMTVRLATLESGMGEEYYALVQAKTLRSMTRQIRQTCNVDLGNILHILEMIIKDEETHQRLLATIKTILARKEVRQEGNTPKVKYLNPDSWTKSLTST